MKAARLFDLRRIETGVDYAILGVCSQLRNVEFIWYFQVASLGAPVQAPNICLELIVKG